MIPGAARRPRCGRCRRPPGNSHTLLTRYPAFIIQRPAARRQASCTWKPMARMAASVDWNSSTFRGLDDIT